MEAALSGTSQMEQRRRVDHDREAEYTQGRGNERDLETLKTGGAGACPGRPLRRRRMVEAAFQRSNGGAGERERPGEAQMHATDVRSLTS
jgi:hypothetical protein